MSIAALLQAAEFIERRDREAEHGYASSLPVPDDLRSVVKRAKSKKSQGSRTSHNELEKNRRAHLRNCLEKLKDIVPLGPDASRHTTLGLLTKAKKFIKNMEERERRHVAYREQLARKQRYLARRLEQLGAPLERLSAPLPAPLARRSLSECSSASASSGEASHCALRDSEPASISESDEVDVIGYTSNQSDTDDHSSVQSGSGDSGVALSASRLSLAHMEII